MASILFTCVVLSVKFDKIHVAVDDSFQLFHHVLYYCLLKRIFFLMVIVSAVDMELEISVK